MTSLKIVSCKDSMMWYRDMVGETVVLAKHPDASHDVYWSREPAGYLNIVNKQDAIVIEVSE